MTLGEDGALHQGKNFPTKKVEIFDVCGAGDTFLSALACSYLITYTGNNERQVQCTSGCDTTNNTSENVEFCEKYRYRDGPNNTITGSLGDTFLDQTYVGRRRGGRDTTTGGG